MQHHRGPGGRTPGAGLARALRGDSGGALAPRRRTRRILAALLPALLAIAAFASSASAALNQVGPIDPTTNFPAWYSDSNGLALQPCRSDLSGNCAAGLYTLPPVGGAPSGEGFYYLAQATVGPLTVTNALEGAYAGTGTGQEGTFVRTFVTAKDGGLTPNQPYTITDPYGTYTCTADANGFLLNNPKTGCRTDVPGIIAGNFTGSLGSRIGPFLTWDTFGGQGIGAPPPAGFIGDGVTAHAVVGSPTGFNKVRVAGPGLTGTCTNPDGTTVSTCQETSLFVVQGQVQPGPSAATSTRALDFGNVATGTPVTKRITYTSTGSAAVNVSGVTLGGTDAADFSEADTCTTTPPATSFAPGASCTIDVTYTPRVGTSNATLTITDDTAGSPRAISLTGSSAPVLNVSTASLDFGSVKVGGTSAQQTVTVSNTGAAPMTVSSTLGGAFPGDFQITTLAASDCSSGTVAPGASCKIAVQFTPTTPGATNATLTVKESLGTSKTVALSGTGTQATFSLSTTSIAFASRTAGTTSGGRSVTVTNNGNTTGTVDGIDIVGTDPSQFTVLAASTCAVGTNLAPTATCVVQVAFAPTTAGTKTATLAISVDGVAKNVALSGTATDGTAPTVPTGVTATATSSTSVTVNWTASTDNVGVAGYQVFRGSTLAGTVTTGTSFTDTGLTPSTAYSYTVKAYDAVPNTSAASAAANVTTPAPPDTQPPTVPTGLTVTPTNATTVSLSWTASTDNVGVAGYKVYRDGVLLKTVTTTSTTDTTVAASSTHSYAVSAIDAAKNESAQTTAISVTTPSATPPAGPTVTTRTPGSGATAVATTSTVSATFSADVSGVSGTTFTLSSGTTQVAATVAYNAVTHVATLTPSAALANDTTYTAAFTTGITNAAGGALQPTSWKFTTGPRPTVSTRTPSSGATGVANTSTVTATFSEAVSGVSSSTFTLKSAAGTAVTASVAYDPTTHVATLTPSAALTNDTKYTATVGTVAGIKDTAGNPITATSWTFTTGPKPTVTARTPAANATGVSRTTSVTGTFSEPVTATTVSATTFTLKTAAGAAVTAAVSYNATTRVATLVPSTTLLANTKYTATLGTGIKDLAGNPLVASSWSFTTGP